MNTKIWVVVLAGSCCAMAVAIAFDRSVELKLTREKLAALDEHPLAARLEDREIARLRFQIEERQHEISQVKAELGRDSGMSRPLATTGEGLGYEDNEYAHEIESWLRRVDRLSEYLEQSEWSRIPELEHLSARDWLDATNAVSLETEADFRRSLAILRRQAKLKVAPKISAALRSFLKASDGEMPSDPMQLRKHLDPGIDKSILERYRINPSGELPRIRLGGNSYLVEDHRPDALYYSTFVFGADGSVGTLGSQGTETMENAIARFEEERGRRPTSGAELMPYYKRDLDVELVEEEFRAMNTRVRLPSEGG